MNERVREIRFLNFRGLPDYLCPVKGKSLAVFAGNGKGKSGIVDGIEFLFSGRLRRFHGEGTGSINPDEAIRHVKKKGETALSFVANHIRRQFGVSAEVIAKRLRAEKLWPPTTQAQA